MRKQYNPEVDTTGEEFYTYNQMVVLSSQERMFKITGPNMFENYNAGEILAISFFDDFVLYPNPYLVVTPSGYSKHYYAGSERIASTIGGNGLLEKTIIEGTQEGHLDADYLYFNTFYNQKDLINYDILETLETYRYGTDHLMTNHPYAGWYSSSSGYELPENRLTNINVNKDYGFVEYYIRNASVYYNSYQGTYYTHSDHIGSAAWIVEQSGTAVQHMQNLPWGEVFADQRLTDYSTRYTFSGKERDAETGFSYFGFRYYLSEYGFWGGVDPLSDKYPSTSSYAYCANNPVMLVDPDGRKPIYDLEGNLLGTDDEGLKGEAIIMNKENFKQGMTIHYDDELNLGIGGLNDQSARDKFYNSYDNLKSRPDYDGHLTLKEAMLWFHYGNGEPLYVDQNQIDLSSVNFNIVSGETQQQFSPLKPTETGLIYGSIYIYHKGGQVTWLGGLDGKLDDYDFDMQKNAPCRNFWTVVGHLINRMYMYKPPIEKYIPYNNPVETFTIYSYRKNK